MAAANGRPVAKRRVRLLGGLAVAALIAGLGVFWAVTAPRAVSAERLAAIEAIEADPARGERVFWAGGCASCHAEKEASGDDRKRLSGGLRLTSDFGTFVVPNISPHPDAGIGQWTLDQFSNAMLAGIAPGGSHLYPSFPYASYVRMSDQDIADLFAHIKTLPASDATHPDHELKFPFSWRRLLGGWKFLFFDDAPRTELADGDAQLQRGQYLVEGPGHCGECHTPRNLLGGLKTDQWLAGAPNPEGEGRVPNITPGSPSLKSWSAADIAYYLESGFTPDFDSVGGSMVAVQKNMAELPSADREAIAAYLKTVPAR
ncbi:cytochrome c [Pseudohoeflea coraliihabitans]|uniref:Cytochrome c n=1 Tax=Pseudohoeflea coraliihabitans TaxID=2860393 RepID=A0ABS6WU94_9HYPH|nr:cytochrome c [Pseudohoeflea sp. DP4N28-3]MBW3098625.1 cytochrome c [Pseudohoeflea sp. DP4N28-3]